MKRRKAEPYSQSGPRRGVAGGLRLNGSWDDHGNPDTPLMNFVREVRVQRRAGAVTPIEVAERIPQAFSAAFPCAEQWLQCVHWHECRCMTSAEALIAYVLDVERGETKLPESDPSDGPTAFWALSTDVMHLISKKAGPGKIADFLEGKLDDPRFNDDQRAKIEEAVRTWRERAGRNG